MKQTTSSNNDEFLGQLKNYNGDNIIIDNITDKELVKLYKFYRAYCNVLKASTSSGKAIKDNQYNDHASSMNTVRETLLATIKQRGLKISSYN